MQYDKKISFALGILLIGIVAAFFFRNEKETEANVPQLKNPKSLDDKIAKKSVTPYESPSRLQGNILEEQSGNGQLLENGSNPTYGNLPEGASNLLTSREPAENVFGPPEPIKTTGATSENLAGGVPVPKHNSQWEPISRKETVPVSTDQRSYRVKSGDTLTSISHRFLGSSKRYKEIFKANRVLMRSPDDLRAGMTLRIPPRSRREKSIVSKPSRERSISNTTTKTTDDQNNLTENNNSKNEKRDIEKTSKSPTKKRRPKLPTGQFIPIRRSPLSPEKNASIPDRPVTRVLNSTGKSTIYVVRSGDSLEKIARRHYGRASCVRTIIAANRGRIRNPNSLQIGTKLVLPTRVKP